MVDATTIIDYTYEEFIEGINKIADDIKQSGFNPDYIVGIVRGGAIPAVYLSHKLRIPVQMVHWSTRDSDNRESNLWIPEDVNDGKRVVIVDDIVDGGETIKELLEDWNSSIRDELKLDNIRVSSMIYNTSQPTNVDFYHRTIDRSYDNRWIHFPWE